MSVKVPLLDLQAQYRPIRAEILSAIERVCDSQRFVMGPEIEALEQELARMLAVRHAVALSSGTDALLVALMALGIGAGDEVVTSAYSFFATAGAIARLGARPVFVDIDETTFNLDPAQTVAAFTPRTKAVIPVHLFGQSADLDPIVQASSRDGIAVVEDAAQAIGATYKSRILGGIGTLGCFSFFPSKNLGAFGDAGLVTTNDPALATRVRQMRMHGMEPRYYHHIVGGNFRMDAIQAAVLRVKAPHLERWTEGRRANARRYGSMFGELAAAGALKLPVEADGCRHIYNQYVIRTRDRDGLKRHLDSCGIGNEIYYPLPLHLQPCFSTLGYTCGDFPRAERAALESLAIPIYAELTEEQQQSVVDVISRYAGMRAGAAG